ACRAPTSLPRRDMPCPDVAAATRHAVPRRRCRDAACRAPTSPPRRGMPCPDVAAALPISAPPREPV
ncbi:hypothetical protein, partial [Roseiflexus sp.]